MRFLISKGADVHAVTANGDTPLHITLACSHQSTRLETAQILVDSGCDPSHSNSAGKTPLHVAASSGYPSLVKYLRSQNVPLPFDILLAAAAALERVRRHEPGQAPHIPSMFRLLIREGANVNVIAPNEDTLLHIVVRRCSISPRTRTPWKLIGILLGADCDPFVCNADGQTSFDLAEEQGHFFYNNFLRLVKTYQRSDPNRLGHYLQTSRSKRLAEEMNQDMVGRLTKRSRLDEIGDEDEIAEVDEQLMA